MQRPSFHNLPPQVIWTPEAQEILLGDIIRIVALFGEDKKFVVLADTSADFHKGKRTSLRLFNENIGYLTPKSDRKLDLTGQQRISVVAPRGLYKLSRGIEIVGSIFTDDQRESLISQALIPTYHREVRNASGSNRSSKVKAVALGQPSFRRPTILLQCRRGLFKSIELLSKNAL